MKVKVLSRPSAMSRYGPTCAIDYYDLHNVSHQSVKPGYLTAPEVLDSDTSFKSQNKKNK